MTVLRALVVVLAALSFNCSVRSATFADEKVTVEVKACAPQRGNDPTIVTKKEVTVEQDCHHPVFSSSAKVVDERYGVEFAVQGPFGVTDAPKAIEPAHEDKPSTHISCTIAYPKAGVVAEWIIPKGKSCDERGQTFRLLKPEEQLCLMPSGKCIKIIELKPVGQKRAQDLKKKLAAQ